MQKEEERTTPAVIRHGALQMWRWLRALMHLREAPLHRRERRARQRRCAAAERHRARQLATAAKESARAARTRWFSMARQHCSRGVQPPAVAPPTWSHGERRRLKMDGAAT